MTQEEIFELVFKKYKDIFPDMKHGSGGLPDTKGPGTSDVDICIFSTFHASLGKHFPSDTEVDSSSPERTIYKLSGYDREVNIYCSDGEWWQNGYLHRQTELALNKAYPKLASDAFEYKKNNKASTEKAWAHILGLGETYYSDLLDTKKILSVAKKISNKL